MAYVDFSGELMPAAPLSTPRPDPVPQTERLSPLEWSVVALARRDRISSLSEPSRVSVALGKVFGTRQRSPHLADPKLEALRRMAVLTWHRGFSVPSREVKAFLAAGFTPGQYETMATSIGATRAQRAAAA